MSTFALLTAGLAAFAPLASAYTTPVGDSPSGNAIYEPGLNSVVTAGKAFTITWEPTTKGNVSLLLCKGPSTNCVITSTLADSIENSGSYSWTPSTDLAPSQPTGYGIELVVEGTGQYQCMSILSLSNSECVGLTIVIDSTQFGVSNPSYKDSSSSSSSSAKSATATAAAAVTASSKATSSTATVAAKVAIDADADASNTTSTASGISAASTAAITGTAYSAVEANGTATSVRGTGVPLSGWSGYANATAIKPTGSMTVPSSLRTSTATGSSTSTGSASSSTPTTGAAAHFGACFGGLAIAAGFAVFAL